jgi:hypothetical protein
MPESSVRIAFGSQNFITSPLLLWVQHTDRRMANGSWRTVECGMSITPIWANRSLDESFLPVCISHGCIRTDPCRFNFTEQRPSLQADSHSGGQEISFLMCKWHADVVLNKSPPRQQCHLGREAAPYVWLIRRVGSQYYPKVWGGIPCSYVKVSLAGGPLVNLRRELHWVTACSLLLGPSAY